MSAARHVVWWSVASALLCGAGCRTDGDALARQRALENQQLAAHPSEKYQEDKSSGPLFRRIFGQDEPAQPAPAAVSAAPAPAANRAGQPAPATTAVSVPNPVNPNPAANYPVVPVSADMPLPGVSAFNGPGNGVAGTGAAAEPAEESMWSWMWPSTIYRKMKEMTGTHRDESQARALMAEAEKLFREQKFDEASGKYAAAGKLWPDSMLEEDALFMEGECYFFQDRYSYAADCYGRLAKKYENSRHLDKAVARQFTIGRYWVASTSPMLMPNVTDKTYPWIDHRGSGLKQYEHVWLSDPTGPLADDSVMATANYYFVRERWRDADTYYDQLRTNHPQSEHMAQAHILGLQAKMRAYQGADYDATLLSQSDKLCDSMLTAFATETAAERERVLKVKAEIRAEKARRDFETAEFYARSQHFGAARVYYNYVLRDFADTPLAEQAKTRLAEIQSEPDNPPDRFFWLTRWFPDAKSRRR